MNARGHDTLRVVILPVTDPAAWGPSLDAAVNALARGEVIVLPTDTMYGIAADAFQPSAVDHVREAKGAAPDVPLAVLIPSVQTVAGLGSEVSATAMALMEALWPGSITFVVKAQATLAWDLGDSRGTVALRVPDHPAALALLKRTGPLAVSSANRVGEPVALRATEAHDSLGSAASVYLDGGIVETGTPSTVVDATKTALRIVREGAVSRDVLTGIVGEEAFEPGESAA